MEWKKSEAKGNKLSEIQEIKMIFLSGFISNKKFLILNVEKMKKIDLFQIYNSFKSYHNGW